MKKTLSNKSQGGLSPSRRSLRYGKLIRGWEWRTTPELLKQADEARKRLGLTTTEFIELALKKLAEG